LTLARGRYARKVNRTFTAALATCISVIASIPVFGQTDRPDSTAAQSSLSPTIRVTGGWDDNIFRVNEADAPIADFADVLVVGDLFEVGRAMLDELRARSG